MVGMCGLWKMLKTVFSLLVDFSASLPSLHSQPPLYFSWFSHWVGKPVPGFVSTLFHHMYSVPLRSVQMFLQAMLQVWQPMHLSRWNTIATCERTFIAFSSSPLQIRQLAHQDVRVAIAARGSPIVEMKTELAVAAHHQIRLQAYAREAVVPAGAFVISHRRFRNRIGALRRVILNRDASRDAGADCRTRHHHAVIVV